MVYHVLVDLVSSSANATPGLGRYPPFKRESSNKSTKWGKLKINERKIQSARQGYTRGIWLEDCWA
ncbi:hypothetical protein JHK82_047652 [Glycine max]|nr:hypothetical protein JHK82_047652 [Glycine max]